MDMVRRGLAETRTKAQALILAGQVLVDETPAGKAGDRVRPEAVIRLTVEPQRFVSRGGLKLEHALDAFGVAVTGRVAADLGASTGGFTDCLLQRGAARVYAVDVGYGQLAWKLRQDPRVVVLERTNVRHLRGLPEPIALVSGDLSFISLGLVLPAIVGLCGPAADLLLLVKPQFEVGRGRIGKRGLVSDPDARADAVEAVRGACVAAGLRVVGVVESPITGARSGNVEYLLHAVAP